MIIKRSDKRIKVLENFLQNGRMLGVKQSSIHKWQLELNKLKFKKESKIITNVK